MEMTEDKLDKDGVGSGEYEVEVQNVVRVRYLTRWSSGPAAPGIVDLRLSSVAFQLRLCQGRIVNTVIMVQDAPNRR